MSDPTAARTPRLELTGISKSFFGVPVLREVNLSIAPGEIHGLLGANGSGKSTLIKILAGYHQPDAGGWVLADGAPVDLPLSRAQLAERGWSFVHQSLGLVPALTVLDNLTMGSFQHSRPGAINWRAEASRARELLAAHRLPFGENVAVSALTPTQRAMLAVVRAVNDASGAADGDGTVASGCRLLVLDEPTVFLPPEETAELFDLVRAVAANGSAVIFVSHQISEVKALAQRLTVLRDGRVHTTTGTADVSEDDIVAMIATPDVAAPAVEVPAAPVPRERSDTRVVVTDLVAPRLESVSFEVAGGEILGVTGLPGSGAEDLLYFLFGQRRATGGVIALPDGTSIALPKASPAKLIERGVALIPADRPKLGLVGPLSVEDNLTSTVLDRFYGWRARLSRARTGAVSTLMDKFDIRPRNPAALGDWLSGGNQQKIVIAKWLQRRLTLLLAHEPTQGVDVNARAAVYEFLRDSARAGTAVVCANTDPDELAEICDRVLVMRNGRIGADLTGADLTSDRITECCYR